MLKSREDEFMYCKNCGKEIDDKAYVCPHCGVKTGSSFSKGFETGNTGKSKLAAGLFGILLGSVGANNFYLGDMGLGLIDVLFCWTGVPAIVNLVRGILYLCESDDDFEKRIKK